MCFTAVPDRKHIKRYAKITVDRNWESNCHTQLLINTSASLLCRSTRLKIPLSKSEGNPEGNRIPAISTLLLEYINIYSYYLFYISFTSWGWTFLNINMYKKLNNK